MNTNRTGQFIVSLAIIITAGVFFAVAGPGQVVGPQQAQAVTAIQDAQFVPQGYIVSYPYTPITLTGVATGTPAVTVGVIGLYTYIGINKVPAAARVPVVNNRWLVSLSSKGMQSNNYIAVVIPYGAPTPTGYALVIGTTTGPIITDQSSYNGTVGQSVTVTGSVFDMPTLMSFHVSVSGPASYDTYAMVSNGRWQATIPGSVFSTPGSYAVKIDVSSYPVQFYIYISAPQKPRPSKRNIKMQGGRLGAPRSVTLWRRCLRGREFFHHSGQPAMGGDQADFVPALLERVQGLEPLPKGAVVGTPEDLAVLAQSSDMAHTDSDVRMRPSAGEFELAGLLVQLPRIDRIGVAMYATPDRARHNGERRKGQITAHLLSPRDDSATCIESYKFSFVNIFIKASFSDTVSRNVAKAHGGPGCLDRRLWGRLVRLCVQFAWLAAF